MVRSYSVKLIIFIGPSGVGKSTQVQILNSLLRKHGKKLCVKVETCRIGTNEFLSYALSALIANAVILSFQRDKMPFKHPITILHRLKPEAFKKIFGLWLFLDVLSIYIKTLFSICVKALFLRGAKIVLCEELGLTPIIHYIHLARVFNIEFKKLKWAIKMLTTLLWHTNPTIILLDASSQDLVYRWYSRGFYNQDKIYLKERYNFIELFKKLMILLPARLGLKHIYVNTSGQHIYQTTKTLFSYILKIKGT